MSLSSELGKRKTCNKNINNSNSPFKKQKLSSSLNNKSYSFPSLICNDCTGVTLGSYDITISKHFTLCISNDKKVYSVGYSNHNSHGHKEKKIFPIKQIQGLTNIKMISCGIGHSICLDYHGDVFSFGSNCEGQLGIGKKYKECKYTLIPQKINVPYCKQVSCGENFTICVTEDNTLYSFGKNLLYSYYILLGFEKYDKYIPPPDYKYPQLIPDINNIEFVTCGHRHVICKTYDNEFYCWGDNYYGQLGQGHIDSTNKILRCNNWPDNIIDIKCGDNHTLLLTSEGQVYSFGNNSGQLGINDIINKINTPQLIDNIPEIQRIECGNYHSICIDINDNLWLFGHNSYGELGLGDKKNRYNPVLHPTLSNIMDISSGGNHTFVKTIDNKIYAFGANYYSQLGIKTLEDDQLTPIQVLEGNEDMWCSTIGKSKQKSARK